MRHQSKNVVINGANLSLRLHNLSAEGSSAHEASSENIWAHVRRKFFEATPKQADKQSLGRKGLAYCDQMFSLEASWAELPSAERLCKRKERLAPLMKNGLSFAFRFFPTISNGFFF